MFERLIPMLGNALPGVLLLGLVIFVHELGHFLAAKWLGVTVIRFSLGFGPRLAGFERGGTEYRLSWIPLGGYVQMAGDSPSDGQQMPQGPEQFLSHPWPGRMLIAFAGPLANLVTAALVMILVAHTGVSYPDAPNVLGATPDTSVAFHAGLREGDRVVAIGRSPVKSWVAIFLENSRVPHTAGTELTAVRGADTLRIPLTANDREPLFSSLHRSPEPAVVGNVMTGMPAYKAGVQDGDQIRAVDGDSIANWDDLRSHISARADRPVRLTVVRDGRRLDLMVTPVNSTGQTHGTGQIGIEPPSHGVYIERHGWIESLDLGARATVALVGSVYRGMWLTVTRPLYYREYMGGPLFIAQAASEQARRGLDSYLQFLAMINVGIMAFNLLPLPVLDGGHILLALFEAIRRRAISARAYLNFQRAGLVLLGTLFVLILANDPWRLIERHRALERSAAPAAREKTVAPSSP